MDGSLQVALKAEMETTSLVSSQGARALVLEAGRERAATRSFIAAVTVWPVSWAQP